MTTKFEERPVCEACKAPLVWAETPKGKKMPLDADPDPAKGTYWLFPREGKAPLAQYARNETLLDDRPRFVPHFATCPDAERFRR